MNRICADECYWDIRVLMKSLYTLTIIKQKRLCFFEWLIIFLCICSFKLYNYISSISIKLLIRRCINFIITKNFLYLLLIIKKTNFLKLFWCVKPMNVLFPITLRTFSTILFLLLIIMSLTQIAIAFSQRMSKSNVLEKEKEKKQSTKCINSLTANFWLNQL